MPTDRMTAMLVESRLVLPGLVSRGLTGTPVSIPADDADPRVMTTETTAPERDARDRLPRTATPTVVVAAAVYELIARRLPAPEADILRRMAQAENGHRARLEARSLLEVPRGSGSNTPDRPSSI